MRVNKTKLDLALARACKNARQLRSEISGGTIARIYEGKEIKPQTVGKLAVALGVDPADLIEQED